MNLHCTVLAYLALRPSPAESDCKIPAVTYYFRESEPDKANFPILVNDNNSYLLCKIKDGKMVIDVVGANGKDKKQHQFDVKF